MKIDTLTPLALEVVELFDEFTPNAATSIDPLGTGKS